MRPACTHTTHSTSEVVRPGRILFGQIAEVEDEVALEGSGQLQAHSARCDHSRTDSNSIAYGSGSSMK